MVEILDTKERSLDDRNRLSPPSGWIGTLGFEDEEEVEVGLLYSEKHGYHLGVWAKGEQPKK